MQSTCITSLCAALFWLCPSLSAQPVTFQKLYGGSGDQAGNYVVEAQDGGYLIAGSTTDPNLPSDGYLLRVNIVGDILWQKRIGGSNKDAFQVAKQTADGGFIVLGETASTGGGDNDIWLVKITAAGDVAWERVFGGFNSDLGRGLLVLPDGYVISGPQSSAGPSNQSTYVIRLNAAGQTIWSKTYFSGISNILQVEYAAGNTLFACGGLDTHGAFVRLDAATGDVLSTLSFGGSGPEALYHSRPTLDGNLVLANHTWSVTGGVELLFESKPFGECWDGTFRGKPVAAGVYVWTIEFYADPVHEERVLSGDVTLIR